MGMGTATGTTGTTGTARGAATKTGPTAATVTPKSHPVSLDGLTKPIDDVARERRKRARDSPRPGRRSLPGDHRPGDLGHSFRGSWRALQAVLGLRRLHAGSRLVAARLVRRGPGRRDSTAGSTGRHCKAVPGAAVVRGCA